MAASIRSLRRAARKRGPHRYYRPLRGSRWTIEENRLWADKRARQRQDLHELETSRGARSGPLGVLRASEVILKYQDGSHCPY